MELSNLSSQTGLTGLSIIVTKEKDHPFLLTQPALISFYYYCFKFTCSCLTTRLINGLGSTTKRKINQFSSIQVHVAFQKPELYMGIEVDFSGRTVVMKTCMRRHLSVCTFWVDLKTWEIYQRKQVAEERKRLFMWHWLLCCPEHEASFHLTAVFFADSES